MKNILIYFSIVLAISAAIAVGAFQVGITRLTPSCPVGTMDCGSAIVYNPFFWFPLRFIIGGYQTVAWPNLFTENYQKVMSLTGMYWILLANIITIVMFFLIKVGQKRMNFKK